MPLTYFSKLALSFTAIATLFIFESCKDKNLENQTFEGSIQVLNGCGAGKVTENIREKLMQSGFDVVETGNADFWNFEETIVAVRNPHWPYAKQLAATLKTKNIILLENSDKLMDATVYIGKDYKKALGN
jgi:hypothetical protein